MGRKVKWPPTVHPHKTSGREFIRVAGHDYYLGPIGSQEARLKYARLVTELAPDRSAGVKADAGTGLCVADLVAAFMEHAHEAYRDERGNPSTEFVNYRCACQPLLDVHQATPLAAFGPKALKDVLRAMVKRQWKRASINRQLVRVRTIFRWGEAEQLVPGGTFETLRTVRGLKVREHQVEESPPVLPVPEGDLEATLPHLSPAPVRAIVDLLLLTSARPGEICRLKAEALDKKGRVEIAKGMWVNFKKVWAYRPPQHKTLWKGHPRTVLVGPEAQATLAPWLLLAKPGEYLFRPERGGRGKPKAARYNRTALLAAVHRACHVAGVAEWNPGQLRHNAGTRLAAKYGLDTARVILGQRSLRVTQGYAIENWEAAAAAVGETG